MPEWKEAIQCPYGPHWHEFPDAEEAVVRCRQSFMAYMPKDILMNPIFGFEEWEIDAIKRDVSHA